MKVIYVNEANFFLPKNIYNIFNEIHVKLAYRTFFTLFHEIKLKTKKIFNNEHVVLIPNEIVVNNLSKIFFSYVQKTI